MSLPSESPSSASGATPGGGVCRDCGTALPAGAAQGFCPVCMFREMDDTLGGDSGAFDDALPLRRMGNYELLEIIGRGGMGTVYRAQHEQSGAVRALKMISAGELASPQARRRFMQEAGAAAGLQHPNIVTIHEVSSQDGMPFYVMDCVEGRTLADAVRERPMPPDSAAACMTKVAAAIQHAHECGVLHRDLKPANILLDQLGEPQVTDFGLARHVNADSSLTGSQQILGSPAYMSPEQAAGRTKALTAAADVYALGAVLYHLLTGRPPFQGESPQAILRQVSDDEPVAPRRILPSIPRELETVALKCLEKNPSRRYVSAAALEHELERYLRGEPILARPVGRAGKCWRWIRRNRAIATLSAVLVAGAAIGMGFMVQSHRQLKQSDAEKSTALTEKEATLAESLLWQAEFQRLTGKPGQREGSLQSIREAMKLPLSPEQKLRARNAVIAAVALPDATFVPDAHLSGAPEPALFLTDPLCQHYATATKEGRIIVTNIKDGTEAASFDVAPRRINALLRWSDDGLYIAYRYDDTMLGMVLMTLGNFKVPWTAQVWPAAARSTPNQVGFHPLPGPGVTRPHRVMYPEPDGGIVLREAFSGYIYRRVPPPEGYGAPEWRALAWDPVGNRLAAAAGSRPEIVIWDMNAGPPKIVQTLHCRAPVESLDWEVRENWLLAGDNEGRLTIWNPTTGKAQPPFEGHSQAILSSTTGWANYRHATASMDGTIRLWDRTAYRPVLTLPGQATRIFFTKGESSVGPVIHDGQAGWYQLQWPACLRVLNSFENSEGNRCVVMNDNSLFLASLTGRSVVVWKMNPVSGHHLSIPVERPAVAEWMTNSARLMVAAPEGLMAYTLRPTNRTPLAAPGISKTQKVMEGAFGDVSFNGDSTLMAVVRTDTGRMEVYNIESPGIGDDRNIRIGQQRLSVPAVPGTRCRLSPDGLWLAAGSPAGNDARVYKLEDGSLAAEPPRVREARNWLPAFSRDGALLMFGGRTANVLACGDWTRCDDLAVPPNNGTGNGVEFVNVGRGEDFLAAVGADEEIYLFRRGEPRERIAVLRPPVGAAIGWLQCARSGMLCAGAPRGEVHLWILAALRTELEKAGVSWKGDAPVPAGPGGK